MGSSVTFRKEYHDYVCVDLETSCGNIYSAEIIEIGAVKVENDVIVDTFGTLVKPVGKIDRFATRINGITENDVANAPSIEEVFDSFLGFIGESILLGHNIAAFDLQILREVGRNLKKQINNQYVDTLNIAVKLLPELPSHSLTSLCEYYDIRNDHAHRALSDCMANIEVYNALMQERHGNASSITKKNKSIAFIPNFSETSKMLMRLVGIVEGMTCDGEISEKEVTYLSDWLDKHTELKGNFQYDNTLKAINSEHEERLSILKNIVDPVENFSECTESVIDYNNKIVCLSGDFITASKSEIAERLSELGATVRDSVVKDCTYLIVGGNGSTSWTSGNYGNKVKKALEMQAKGRNVKILKEEEALKGIEWNN